MKNERISTTHKSIWDSTTGQRPRSPHTKNPVWIPVHVHVAILGTERQKYISINQVNIQPLKQLLTDIHLIKSP